VLDAVDTTHTKPPIMIIIMYCIVLYCIVSIHLYSVSCSAHQSEAHPLGPEEGCNNYVEDSHPINSLENIETTYMYSLQKNVSI